MPMKSKPRSHRRHKKCTRRNRRTRRRGGAENLVGAPLDYKLAGEWSSRMSHGQGGDYLKYHQGQHGGNAPYPESFNSPLDPSLRGPAMLHGLDGAFRQINTLNDQTGGKRRRRSRRRRHSRRSRRKSCSRRRRRSRRKGGSLGYSPYGTNPMLLESPAAYAEAGLHPGWKTDVALEDANIRQGQ